MRVVPPSYSRERRRGAATGLPRLPCPVPCTTRTVSHLGVWAFRPPPPPHPDASPSARRQVGLEADVPQFACDFTLEALEDTDVRCAPMDASLWG